MKRRKCQIVNYDINDQILVVNFKSDIDFDTELSFDFLFDNLSNIKKEVVRLLKNKKIRLEKNKIKIMVNGILLTTLIVANGYEHSSKDYSELNQTHLIQESIIQDAENQEIILNEPVKESSIVVSNPNLKMMNLVLIAGHSDLDPGAVYNNRYEAKYAQELVDLISQQLKSRDDINVNVILEPSPVALVGEMEFLKATDCDYAISIHFNAGGGSGSEIIVPYKSTDLTIAQETLENFQKFGQSIRSTPIYSRSSSGKTARVNQKRVAVQTDYFGIIRTGSQKNIPSDIIEIEFIDNQKGMDFYDLNKTKYAQSIVDAIASYYNKNFL